MADIGTTKNDDVTINVPSDEYHLRITPEEVTSNERRKRTWLPDIDIREARPPSKAFYDKIEKQLEDAFKPELLDSCYGLDYLRQYCTRKYKIQWSRSTVLRKISKAKETGTKIDFKDDNIRAKGFMLRLRADTTEEESLIQLVDHYCFYCINYAHYSKELSELMNKKLKEFGFRPMLGNVEMTPELEALRPWDYDLRDIKYPYSKLSPEYPEWALNIELPDPEVIGHEYQGTLTNLSIRDRIKMKY